MTFGDTASFDQKRLDYIIDNYFKNSFGRSIPTEYIINRLTFIDEKGLRVWREQRVVRKEGISEWIFKKMSR